MKKYLSVSDVAKMLSLELETVRIKARRKIIKGYKFGRDWKFLYEDVKKFIDSCASIHN